MDDGTWTGGFYEAALVLGKIKSAAADERLRRAITVLWSNPRLSLSRDLDMRDLDNIGRIEGVLDHPTLGSLVCGSFVVREREETDGDDWLYAVVPLGGLSERIDTVGAWPAGDTEGSRSWREPLEQCLSDLALEVSRAVPIRLAMIGYEIAGMISEFKPDQPRRIGFVVRDEASEYRYWPTTDWS